MESKKFVITQSLLNTLLDAIGTSISKKYTTNDIMLMVDTVNKLPEYIEHESDEIKPESDVVVD